MAAGGAEGWSSADLLPYFLRSETAPGRGDRYRGSSGPMRVAPATSRHPIAEAGLAAVRALGYPVSPDLNGAHRSGGGLLEMNVADGYRQSAYDAYIRPARNRPNLRITTQAEVLSLVLEDGRCTGVRYLRDGIGETVRSARVVLCAGAIGSPRLLLSSGIGPAADLEKLDIDVEVDLPGVGRNLQDHPLAGVVYSAQPGFPGGTNNHADAVAMLASDAKRPSPDVQLLFMDVPFHPPTLPGPSVGFTIGVALLRPRSRGTVSLVSANPLVSPRIDPGFYSDRSDLDTMVEAVRLARTVGSHQAFDPWRATEALPGPKADSDEDLSQFLRNATGTYFHAAGTCRMGAGTDAVLDTQLRVQGVRGLYVADASMMPELVSANTNATVLAVAERAAEWLSTDGDR